MEFPTVPFENLRKTFELIKDAEYKGFKGVMAIESENPGPTIGITMCTHGNEPSGLASLYYALKDDYLKTHIQKGRVLFILNNIKAAEASFLASNFEERLRYRFIDMNMNRIPSNILELQEDERYEVQRALELYPLYQEIDIALDMHSTSTESPPMIIECGTTDPKMLHGFPIDVFITNIHDKLNGYSVTWLYGGIEKTIPVLTIESGSHEEPHATVIAAETVFVMFENEGILPIKIPRKDKYVYKHYKVHDSLFFPDDSYIQPRLFTNFELMIKGQVLGTGNGDDIVCPIDGHALLPRPTIKPLFINEAVVYITEPVKEIMM